MQNLLDILGSFLIGGILLLMVLNFNLYTMSTSISSDKELIMHQNAKTLAEILSYDLRKIGYNYTGTSIITADSNRLKYYADLQPPNVSGHGIIDIVEYRVVPVNSGKPNDFTNYKLVRIINNLDTLAGGTLGITKFRFSYFNAMGIETKALDSIKYIKAEFWIHPTVKFNNPFISPKDSTFTYWEMTINPRNI